MATNFPTSLDNLSNPTGTTTLAGSGNAALSHSSQHTNANDAIEAIQAVIGVTGSSDTASITYKLSNLPSSTNSIEIGDIKFVQNSPNFLTMSNGQVLQESQHYASYDPAKHDYPAIAALQPNITMLGYGTSNAISPAWTGGINAGITYAFGLYIRVGTDNILYSSPDLLPSSTWTARQTTVSQAQTPIFTGSLLVAQGSSSTTVYTSTDGITWTARTTPAITLNQIYYGNGLFIQVGSTGVINTSPDGITWSARVSGTTQSLRAVIWTGSQFIAAGNGNVRCTSPDGITWTVGSFSGPAGNTVIYSMKLFAGKLFCVSQSSQLVVSTNDLLTISNVDGIGQIPTFYFESVQTPSNLFFRLVESNVHNVYMYTSDGVSWNSFAIAGSQTDQYLYYVNNQLVAIHRSSTPTTITFMPGEPPYIGLPVSVRAPYIYQSFFIRVK